MKSYEIGVDYFIDTVEDGNSSLPTIKERYEELRKELSENDTILLAGLNKIVSTEKELINAIEEHLKTKK
jgi:GTPase SAR1 family protein